MRATIAKRLSESKATIPHTYTRTKVRVDRLFAIQKAVNKVIAPNKISVNDLIVKACAFGLRIGFLLKCVDPSKYLVFFHHICLRNAYDRPKSLTSHYLCIFSKSCVGIAICLSLDCFYCQLYLLFML
ncbi:unnamed protein product [Dibothriocephalus latus]|uniref:2-oxoacid dehydrogenase acyltransferase catalytic domain-containing protein n=1 Tax=Dibothriocephalus latus TaxID=60516 RepID=A0A3P7N912_DIBLA|nr:unnamed protein product [Dibothriocephalus latus]